MPGALAEVDAEQLGLLQRVLARAAPGMAYPLAARYRTLRSIPAAYAASADRPPNGLELILHHLRRAVAMAPANATLALCEEEVEAIFRKRKPGDLAGFRGRHPFENRGDIPAVYREYERVTGTPIDRRVVGYYTVAFLQLAVIGATFFMMPEIRGGNWIEGMLEKASITRRAYEAIAELHGLDLDNDLTLPDPTPDSLEASGLRKLIADIARLPTSSAFAEWERDLLGAIPDFLLNCTRYRNWFETVSRTAELARVFGIGVGAMSYEYGRDARVAVDAGVVQRCSSCFISQMDVRTHPQQLLGTPRRAGLRAQ